MMKAAVMLNILLEISRMKSILTVGSLALKTVSSMECGWRSNQDAPHVRLNASPYWYIAAGGTEAQDHSSGRAENAT